MTRWAFFALSGFFVGTIGAQGSEPEPPPRLVEALKIWDAAPHNAFTDLIRYKGRWFCVFREGHDHVSPDGALRVITSKDAKTWAGAALITSTDADLRDPKITRAPRGELLLTAAGALHPPAGFKHQSLAWFSRNGQTWIGPANRGEVHPPVPQPGWPPVRHPRADALRRRPSQ